MHHFSFTKNQEQFCKGYIWRRRNVIINLFLLRWGPIHQICAEWIQRWWSCWNTKVGFAFYTSIALYKKWRLVKGVALHAPIIIDLVEFKERGTRITSEVYYNTFKKLGTAIQNQHRGLLTSGAVFMHDSARPHNARRTKTFFTHSIEAFLIIPRTARTWLRPIFICSLPWKGACSTAFR